MNDFMPEDAFVLDGATAVGRPCTHSLRATLPL